MTIPIIWVEVPLLGLLVFGLIYMVARRANAAAWAIDRTHSNVWQLERVVVRLQAELVETRREVAELRALIENKHPPSAFRVPDTSCLEGAQELRALSDELAREETEPARPPRRVGT